MWQKRASFKTDGVYFGLVVDNLTLYIAGGSSWPTLTTEVRSVSVRDVIEDKRGAHWTHHATLPQPAVVHAFSPEPLYRPKSASGQESGRPGGCEPTPQKPPGLARRPCLRAYIIFLH